jgi:arylsulfatase A-like enzyme
MTDKAIKWTRQQKSLMPDKPFFMYFAPGATHAPHHVSTAWSDKYKGRFDQGWDARPSPIARLSSLPLRTTSGRLGYRPGSRPWAAVISFRCGPGSR